LPTLRFEALIPKSGIDVRRLERELRSAIDKTIKAAEGDFKRTTRTWDQQPTFKIVKAHAVGGDLEGEVATENEIYRYVTRGTRPHVIRPRRKQALRFQKNYQAKTAPQVVGSHKGGASGDFVSAKQVQHPGSAGRNFDIEIAERRQRTLENNVTAAILKAVKK
jgi:hypothetical protein